MGKTEICWVTDSWNPITGCSHAGSPGCDHCYARRMAKRLAGRYGYPASPHEFDVTFHPDELEEPLHWKKPRVVFVCSMSDLFHEDVDYQWLDIIFAAMSIAQRHTFLILTKRPALMGEYLSADRGGTRYTPDRIDEATADEFDYWDQEDSFVDPWPLRNVWLGVSVEAQDQMWRVGQLLQIPAAKHFVSFEPLLGPIDCADLDAFLPWLEGREVLFKGLDGVVVGGESGPGARPMHPDWARSIRDQCLAAGVPFTFKQWGQWSPDPFEILNANSKTNRAVKFAEFHYPNQRPCRMVKIRKKAAGRELDGQIWDEFPWKLIEEG